MTVRGPEEPSGYVCPDTRSPIFTIIDCNNFWSPTGGGVRRYHLEKIADYAKHQRFRLIFVMHDEKLWTEQVATNIVIEHIPVRRVNKRSDYRFLLRSKPLIPIFRKYQPDIVEIGSPYIMPMLVAGGLQEAGCTATKRLAFWHADFPATYAHRLGAKIHPLPAKIFSSLAWIHARRQYKALNGIFCSSRTVIERLADNGLKNTFFLPLGVDTELFNPSRFSSLFREIILKNNVHRGKILFFPHRFDNEKGLPVLLSAFERILVISPEPVALVFAGKGPLQHLVDAAAARHPGKIHFRGFVTAREEMAMMHASCDLGLALSSWETFGLSMLESMASGQAQVAANGGAAAEHAVESGAGLVIDASNSDILADTILHLLFSPLLSKLRVRARHYSEKFTWGDCFDRQRQYYQMVSTTR